MPGSNLTAQRAQEVFHLPENANQLIPEDVRNQFQQDANGHVLFWTTPPVDTLSPVKPKSAIAHTARYLADKIRAKRAVREKRKVESLPAEDCEQPQPAAKKAKQEGGDALQDQIEGLTVKAIWKWNDQMQRSTDNNYKSLYGVHWEEGKKIELEKLAKLQADERQRQADLKEKEDRRSDWEKCYAAVTDPKIYKDDWDPRY